MKKIRKCPSCNEYKLSERCDSCDERTINPKPPKYSPEDRYGKYRRKQKKNSN